jgi:uncharacterized protein YebE (UPF0316 family)
MIEALLGALLIFCLRIGDVSIGTLRTIYMVRGDRLRAAPLAFLESGIWVIAISRIMRQMNEPNLLYMTAYAAGFAAGTVCGITLDRWIASGWVIVRVISRAGPEGHALVTAIRATGFGVTVLPGEGRAGGQNVLFIVAHRRRSRELLQLVEQMDEQAFVTIDPVNKAIGGYLPHTAGGANVRK